jgi:hypothetical protein
VPVYILVADGIRPDTLAAALDTGTLPALARLRAEGGLHPVTSVFPSVTGPAYAPFVMGRYPADVGLPALRWFDRARSAASWPHYTRSYVGVDGLRLDGDLDASAPTAWELAGRSLGALNVISRGLPRRQRLGRSLGFIARVGRTHFRGDVRGWLDIDREIGERLVRRVRDDRPEFVFAALTGVDKTSHSEGHDAPGVRDALGIVDEVAAGLRDEAERAGAWEATHLWIVSDHGHSPVTRHDDLAAAVRDLGHRVVAHPWVYATRPDVAVMVSGNAMAHVYVELARRERPWWPALAERWEPLAAALLARPSVDLLLLPHGEDRCEVRARGRGAALVERTRGRDGASRYAYRMLDGDPLGLGADVAPVDADAAHERTLAGDYPDALVQVAHLAGSARAGELILSASRLWDFRARFEPIPHVSSHGALHREHMMVPLLVNHPVSSTPRRTVDVFASAMTALGKPVPAEAAGRSFV